MLLFLTWYFCLLSFCRFNRVYVLLPLSLSNCSIKSTHKEETWGEYWIRQVFSLLLSSIPTRREKKNDEEWKNTAIILILLRLNVMHFFHPQNFFLWLFIQNGTKDDEEKMETIFIATTVTIILFISSSKLSLNKIRQEERETLDSKMNVYLTSKLRRNR